MQYFSEDHKFKAYKTTYGQMNLKEAWIPLGMVSADQVATIIDEHADNAVILTGSYEDIFGNQDFDPPIAVAKTANKIKYWAGKWPVAEPDDIIIEDADIGEVLRESTIEYYE